MLWTDIYLFESSLWEDLDLQSIIGGRAVETREDQFIENDVVQI